MHCRTTLLVVLSQQVKIKNYLSIININLMSLMCTALVTDSLGLWNHSTCSCHKSQGNQSIETNFIRKWKPARTSQLTAETFLLHWSLHVHYLLITLASNLLKTSLLPFLSYRERQSIFRVVLRLKHLSLSGQTVVFWKANMSNFDSSKIWHNSAPKRNSLSRLI